MKLLVFAHVPPPHHGQSYMVKLMLDGFGGDRRQRKRTGRRSRPPTASSVITSTPSFPRRSKTSANSRASNSLRLLLFCLEAVWCRFRYGVDTFYYVPAPGKHVALYRDWLVMFLCRPFFKNIILHWHAAGLAKWLETAVQIRTRAVTYRLFKRPALEHRPLRLQCRRRGKTLVAAHSPWSTTAFPIRAGILQTAVLPRRKARRAARAKLLWNETVGPAELAAAGGDPHIVKVLYLAHCMREKGLFAAVEAVALANRDSRRPEKSRRE